MGGINKLFYKLFIFLLLLFIFPKVTFAQTPAQIDCVGGFQNLFSPSKTSSITYKKIQLTNPRPIVAQIIKVDLNDHNLDFAVTPRTLLGTTTTTFLNNFHADVAINGQGFTMPNFDVSGFAAAEGNIYSTDPVGGLTLFISQTNQAQFLTSQPQTVWDAMSGPNDIVINGNVNSKMLSCMQYQMQYNSCPIAISPYDCDGSYCTVRARTTVGINLYRNEMIIITVDEIPTGTSEGAYLGEMGQMMYRCGATNAVNMDGGGSTTLTAAADNTVIPGQVLLNRPSGGSERRVANHLGICVGQCIPISHPLPPGPALPQGEARPRYQIGNNYPFPCNKVAPEDSHPQLFWSDEEFHSLRPYQGSPCNPNKEDLALFCGNDLFIGNTVDIDKHLSLTPSYYYGGSPIIPNPPFPPLPNACHYCDQNGNCILNRQIACLPTADQCSVSNNTCGQCQNNGYSSGTETCSFTITGTKNFQVSMSGAQLPIMGYTEPSYGNTSGSNPKVINSINPQNETLSDKDKVNEYVSWYLNGVIGRKEYSDLDVTSDCIGESRGIPGYCMLNIPGNCTNPFVWDGISICTPLLTRCCVNPNNQQSSILDKDKLINFSGPIKKLLPFSIQNIERINQVDNAEQTVGGTGNVRHNQEVSDIPAIQIFLPFIQNPINLFNKIYRLTNWLHHKPPIEENTQYLGQNFNNFLIDYHTWRGQFCLTLTINILGNHTLYWCFNNPITPSPNFYSILFPYIPFSSTEDRLGEVSVKSAALSFAASNFRVLWADVSNLSPANLFFSHMLEDTQLADLLQKTYAAKGIDRDDMTNSGYIPNSPYCDVRQVRTNPGDDLFAGDISGTASFSAQLMCNFFVWGDGTNAPVGNLCQHMINGGNCRTLGGGGLTTYCDHYYTSYDCGGFETCVSGYCEDFSGGAQFCLNNNGWCVPSNWSDPSGIGCQTIPGVDCNSAYFKCVSGGNSCRQPIETPPQSQSCSTQSWINMRLETQTPLADKAWAKLVAGSAGIFRKMFPKIGTGGAIDEIWDMPASTNVSYQAVGASSGDVVLAGNPASGRPGSAAELYFPHIGGIKEYFLTGIQTLLRPKGYGRQLLTCAGYPDCGTQIPPGVTPGPVNNTDICSAQCTKDATLGRSLNSYLLDATLRYNFSSVANSWFGSGCTGNPRINRYDQVITDAYTARVNPIFALAIWLHETDASNYQCICQYFGNLNPNSLYCQRIQDFGYNISAYETVISLVGNQVQVVTDNFDQQLSHFLPPTKLLPLYLRF